jgi:cell division protein ZapA
LKHAVQVTILGQQYTIKSDADPDEVRRVAIFVNERIAAAASAGRIVDSLDSAVLALLNVAGDYLRCSDAEATLTGELTDRLEQLLHKIDNAWPGSRKGPGD